MADDQPWRGQLGQFRFEEENPNPGCSGCLIALGIYAAYIVVVAAGVWFLLSIDDFNFRFFAIAPYAFFTLLYIRTQKPFRFPGPIRFGMIFSATLEEAYYIWRNAPINLGDSITGNRVSAILAMITVFLCYIGTATLITFNIAALGILFYRIAT
jgi:hypothetical protein